MAKDNATYHQIIEAAFELVIKHGIEKTSLSMIASKVGISKPAIYYYFPSKEALVETLFEATFKDYTFASCFNIDQYTTQNFESLLITDGLKMLPEGDEDFRTLRLVGELLILVSRDEKYARRFQQVQLDFLHGFTSLLQKGVELGVVSKENTVAKAHMLAMVIDNLSSYMFMGIPVEYTDIWKEAIKHVISR